LLLADALPLADTRMNSTLLPPVKQSPTAGRILAIEPDTARAQILRESLEQSPVDLEIVTNAEEAIRSMSRSVPHLVITSTFLPPADEALLTAHVRQMSSAPHLQIVNLPYFLDRPNHAAAPQGARTKVLSFLRRQPPTIRPRCDVTTLRQQIEEYLQQALAGWSDLTDRTQSALVHAPRQSEIWLSSSARPVGAGFGTGASRAQTTILGQRDDRRRARRRRSEDLPSLWAIRLPSASDVGVVDISTSGVLLETTSKFSPGTTVDLQLVGEDMNLHVPARMVRADIAGVDGLGVRYRVAAAFSRELDLLELQPAAAPALTPKALADVLARVLGEVDRSTKGAGARERFEYELRRLLPVRDIQIRQNPIVTEPGTESIYFTVPHAGSPQILQAVFDSGHELSSMEFRMLKAAAGLATAVLELAPASVNPRVAARLSA
jgi:CheY-like chemotaxis protein